MITSPRKILLPLCLFPSEEREGRRRGGREGRGRDREGRSREEGSLVPRGLGSPRQRFSMSSPAKHQEQQLKDTCFGH